MSDSWKAKALTLLTAWIGSHHTYATEAAELGAGFTVGTCELAEAFLVRHP